MSQDKKNDDVDQRLGAGEKVPIRSKREPDVDMMHLIGDLDHLISELKKRTDLLRSAVKLQRESFANE